MLALNRIYNVDVMEGLSKLEDQSIDCIITSPPYWALRDYGVDGQIGLERSPQEYIEKIVSIFSEAHRVLKNEGTLWLNLGDGYCGSGKGRNADGTPNANSKKQKSNQGSVKGNLPAVSKGKLLNEKKWGPSSPFVPGLKPKDMIGVPWRVAFALQDKGWYLRSDIIWNKPNAMPESVTDRPTKSHEYIFLLSKSQRYYYDANAIKEPAKYQNIPKVVGWAVQGPHNALAHSRYRTAKSKGSFEGKTGEKAFRAIVDKKNKRSVWTISTQPFKGSHFATFPEKLIEPMILAGCPEGGAVLDPFMGSGTVGLMARKLNRNFLGFELNPEYVEMAEARIKPFMQQKKLNEVEIHG